MNEKFVPYIKLSKKKQRELDLQRRGSWGQISPVTRTAASAKKYDRKKTRLTKADFDGGSFAAYGYLLNCAARLYRTARA